MHGSGSVPHLDAPLALGTVGWDSGEHFELGDQDNDSNTLVHVTLHRGRDPSVPLDQKAAQGQKLLCKVAGGFFRVPPLGTTVIVAIPEPFGRIPGGSVIIAAMDLTPGFLGSAVAGDIIIGTPGNQARIFVKMTGDIALYTQRGNTKTGDSVAIQANADGSCSMAGPFGAFASSQGSTQVAFGADSGMQCDANGVTATGQAIGLSGASGSLGATPTDGIVCGTLLAAQLTQLATWIEEVGAAFVAMASVGGVLPPSTVATASAMAEPNASTSWKVTQ